MVALIISIVALAISIIAFAIASKNKKEVTVQKETKVICAPVEHPFVYDGKCYSLDGDLKVSGSVTCLKDEKE